MARELPVERKYALTKIKRGDYLLPSNDGKTIWRLCTYEDGVEQGLDHDLGTVWGVWKWEGSGDTIDPQDWDRWGMYESSLATRAEAIEAALKMGAGDE